MRKILLLLVATQALAFNAIAGQYKTPIITSYLWTQKIHNAQKAPKKSVIKIDPLLYPHTDPGNVMSTVNTTLIFWGKSWNNSTFVSDKIVGLNYLYNNIHSSSYIDTVSEYTTLDLYLITQKNDTSTIASSTPSKVLAEVCKIIGSANIDPNGYYPVYADIKRGYANYCAYHSAGTCNGKLAQFAFFFNLDNDPGCDPASPYAPTIKSATSQKPGSIAGKASTYQQSQGLAALANVTAHELAEAVTDPAYFSPKGSLYWGGWYDSAGDENGDKCAWTFGPSATGASIGTVMIGAFAWKLQGEWSNDAQINASGYPTQKNSLFGCISGS